MFRGDFDSAPRSSMSGAQLVQRSFQQITPQAELVAELFYGRLFLLDPSLRPLFRGDLKQQGRKLMSSLRVVVSSLDRFETILPVVEALGRRHVAYGVRDDHYDTVRSALIWALSQVLEDELTPAVAVAWGDVYDRVADAMKRAARMASTLPPPSMTSRAPSSRPAPLSSRPPLSARAPLSSRAPLSRQMSSQPPPP